MRRILAAAALAATIAAVDAAAQQPQRPKMLAFVVGIEHYDDAKLDKLQFAADDAKALYAQLQVLTVLQPGSKLLYADDKEQSTVSAELIRTEFQRFVGRIQDGTNVLVYLGGHGIASPAGTLWYLPSNYSHADGTNYLAFSDITNMFKEKIKGGLQDRVSVTYLLNMCGAGNALQSDDVATMGEASPDLLEATRKVLQSNPLGQGHYAIIPATGIDEETFESTKLQASRFAYHLLEGLAGPAANKDGTVTAASVLEYMKAKLAIDLPTNQKFAGGNVLGLTQELEGEADLSIGTALLATARTMDTDDLNSEAVAHRGALLDLASMHFGRVALRAPALGMRALLRRAQTESLRRRPLDAITRDPLLQSATGDSDQAELKELLAPANHTSYATARELHDALVGGEQFYALILEGGRGVGIPIIRDRTAAWRTVFQKFPGVRGIESGPLPATKPATAESSLPSDYLNKIRDWSAAAGDVKPRLIVVYSGLSDAQSGRLWPFGMTEINAIDDQWPGPITIFHLGPGGGWLVEAPTGSNDISLLVAAREKDGMTMSGSGSQPSTSELIAQAFDAGAEPLTEYKPLGDFIARFNTGRAPGATRIGTPAWFPVLGASPTTNIAREQTEVMRRFALHVASSCAFGPLADCDTRTLARLGETKSDPFEVLSAAAKEDLSGNNSVASTEYSSAAQLLREAAKGTDADPAAKQARVILQSIAEIGDDRAKSQKTTARRAVIIPIAITDYRSPLVADLPDASGDIEAYVESLKATLNGRARVEVRPAKSPATAKELLDLLGTERDSSQPNDLLLLVYSGRGFESEGRRVLSTAGTQPCGQSSADSEVPCDEEWTEVVDLWDIAELMKGHVLFAIYDAQFTTPTADGDRLDQLLDKNLRSGRPIVKESASDDSDDDIVSIVSTTKRTGDAPLDTRPRRALPPGQIHLWVEGTLTAAVTGPLDCAPEGKWEHVTSPLAVAIASALPPKTPGTYRGWFETLAQSNCFDHEGEALHPIVQGDIDTPLLGSGQGSELIDVMQRDHLRHDANLRTARAILDLATAKFDTGRNRLSQAAVVIAFYMHGRKHKPGTDALNQAIASLRATSFADVPANEAGVLDAIRIELLVRGYALLGEADQARSLLRDTAPALLLQRGLAERLVALTDEAARRQPNTLMEETRETLDAAVAATDADAAALNAAKSHLDDLIRAERARRAEPYSLEPREQKKR